MHAVRGGARVPSKEDRGQVWIMLPEDVHVAPTHDLERCLEVKSDQDAGWVRFGEVLGGLDPFVCSILASHSVLERTCRRHD